MVLGPELETRYPGYPGTKYADMEWKPDDPREKTLDRTLAYHILIKKRWGDTTGKQWGRMSIPR